MRQQEGVDDDVQLNRGDHEEGYGPKERDDHEEGACDHEEGACDHQEAGCFTVTIT